jgi:hypothetical protein
VLLGNGYRLHDGTCLLYARSAGKGNCGRDRREHCTLTRGQNKDYHVLATVGQPVPLPNKGKHGKVLIRIAAYMRRRPDLQGRCGTKIRVTITAGSHAQRGVGRARAVQLINPCFLVCSKPAWIRAKPKHSPTYGEQQKLSSLTVTHHWGTHHNQANPSHAEIPIRNWRDNGRDTRLIFRSKTAHGEKQKYRPRIYSVNLPYNINPNFCHKFMPANTC